MRSVGRDYSGHPRASHASFAGDGDFDFAVNDIPYFFLGMMVDVNGRIFVEIPGAESHTVRMIVPASPSGQALPNLQILCIDECHFASSKFIQMNSVAQALFSWLLPSGRKTANAKVCGPSSGAVEPYLTPGTKQRKRLRSYE
jgi:hypothetical protein